MSSEVPAPVRATLQLLADGLHAILGDRLVGVYLGGSLSLGDYCAASSDLDFLVVTRGALDPEDSLAVGLLHKDLLKRDPDTAGRLEGDYAPLEVLVPEGTTEPVPGCERGKFLPKVGEIMLSADNIANMRADGITFFGSSPADVLPPVTPEQVRDAVRAMLAGGLGPCETPVQIAAELLGLLRSAYALEHGVPVSKSEGGRWGLEHLPSGWHRAIAAALAIRCSAPTPDEEAALLAVVPELPTLTQAVAAL
jgi:hypothetical protein